MPEKININTIILVILTITVGAGGWALSKTYDNLEKCTDQLRQEVAAMRLDMMPRTESKIELESLKLRVSKVELELARLQKKRDP